MRSLRIKKIASVAAGAAMVFGAVAPGFAVTYKTPQEDVKAFLEQARQNITDVQVVVGSKAAIADGVAAARIAAELANLAYVKQGEDQTVTPEYSGGEVTNKAVKVEVTGQTATYTPTSTTYPKELSPVVSGVTKYETNSATIELTPAHLPDVLSEKDIEAEVGGDTETYTYQEKVVLNNVNVQYDEADSPVRGHGLYMYAPRGNIQYVLEFLGNGLPTNANYTEAPEISILGHTYSIDTSELKDKRFVLYSGDEYSVTNTGSYEVNGYTVDIEFGEDLNNLIAFVTVTDPDGNVKTGKITEDSGKDFFDGAISVYVKSIYKVGDTYKGSVRIGAGKIEFNPGEAFPFDNRWTIQSVNFNGDYLKSIVITYGDPSASEYFERGDFQGTVQTGLEQGKVVPGPKNADGDSLFYIELKGFGGATPVDLTNVEFTGMGTGDDAVMQVKYVDRDGKENILDITLPDQYVIGNGNEASSYTTTSLGEGKHIIEDMLFTVSGNTITGPSGNSVTVTDGLTCTQVGSTGVYVKDTDSSSSVAIGVYTDNGCSALANIYDPVEMNTTARYTVVSKSGVGKVLYFDKIDHTGDDWKAVFKVTGRNGDTVETTKTKDPVNESVMFTIASPTLGAGNDITCNVYIDKNNYEVYLYGCDLVPDQVGIGNAVLFDQNNVYLGLTNVVGTTSTPPYVDIDLSAFNASNAMRVAYDADTTKQLDSSLTGYTGSDSYTGMVVGWTDDGSNWNKIADQPAAAASSTNVEVNTYHITPESVEVETTPTTAKLTIPEKARNAVVAVTGIAPATENEATGAGVQTVGEGDTVNGVTINEIVCDVSPVQVQDVTVPAAEQVIPVNANNLVAFDSEATSTYKIVVGSPLVNSLAAQFSADTLGVLKAEGDSVIAVEGNKLLVSGFTGTDTLTAAEELVNLLEQLRA